MRSLAPMCWLLWLHQSAALWLDGRRRVQILFGKFGFAFTELEMDGQQYNIMREMDIIGVMPREDAIADDVPELKPLHDRVLVKVVDSTEVTSGALLLAQLQQINWVVSSFE
jgi:co-chaperonin GroES (HSP10)